VGILAATEQISAERLGRVAVLGELGLEGAIRPVRGALPVALPARTTGLEALVLPRENLPEAGVVSGVRVLGAGNLAELADFLDGRAELPEAQVDLAGLLAERAKHDVDFGEVKGQAHAKRALEVAAVGVLGCEARSVCRRASEPSRGHTTARSWRLPGSIPCAAATS
jgi:magnesium chelatase family protein